MKAPSSIGISAIMALTIALFAIFSFILVVINNPYLKFPVPEDVRDDELMQVINIFITRLGVNPDYALAATTTINDSADLERHLVIRFWEIRSDDLTNNSKRCYERLHTEWELKNGYDIPFAQGVEAFSHEEENFRAYNITDASCLQVGPSFMHNAERDMDNNLANDTDEDGESYNSHGSGNYYLKRLENSAERQITLDFEARYGSYWYPFDVIVLESKNMYSVVKIDKDGNIETGHSEPPIALIKSDLPGWIMDDNSSYKPAFVFRRPLLIRVLIPILILLLFSATIALPLIRSLNASIQAAIALMLGAWGLRQTILPRDAPGYMAIDWILVAEYVLILLALLSYLVTFIWARRRPARVESLSNLRNEIYIASLNGNVYHRSACHVANCLTSTSRLIYPSREAANRDGKHPCQYCSMPMSSGSVLRPTTSDKD